MPAVLLKEQAGVVAWIAVAICAVALVPAGLRWLRVAQREHYIADATSRFALRWWRSDIPNAFLACTALVGLFFTSRWPLAALAPAAVAVLGPLGLPIRGRTSPLVATRRLRTLATVWVGLEAAVLVVGWLLGAPALFMAAGLVVVAPLIDAACALTAPFERRAGQRFVQRAADRLASVKPVVVAVTGSYGKTSTKNHIAHLVTGTKTVVATPASFNNRVGLARAINEGLADGTEVFIAEMGTYGPGEIADMCRWCVPNIAVITAIGPVHLERFKTEDRIVAAKAEITGRAHLVILNVDDERLATLADRLVRSPSAPEVVRCAARADAVDVQVFRDGDELILRVDGAEAGRTAFPPTAQASNLACAVGVALRLGVPVAAILERLADLPALASRLTVSKAPSGVVVIDDTYNANPAGTVAALDVLARTDTDGRRVVVTPGMVELGADQADENLAFSRSAAQVADVVVVVGRTNRRPLLAGAKSIDTVVVRTREEAVDWVRGDLGPGDVVLYENDLPDQYP